MWDTANDIATMPTVFPVIYSLFSIFASVPLILASDLVPGAREEFNQAATTAVWIFFAGLFTLAAHVGVFAVRGIRDRPRSAKVLGVTTALSVLAIPVSLFCMILFGTGPSEPSIYPPIFLVIFELTGLVGQMISWRFADSKPNESPIPHLN